MKERFRRVMSCALGLLLALSAPMGALATGYETGVSYVTDFTSHAEAVAAAKKVDLEKDEEGMVLLKNTGALPLNMKCKISVFGSQAEDFITALDAEGFSVNPTQIAATSYDPDKITKGQQQSLEIYGDVGIITLNRTYGESADAPTALLPNMPEVISGQYDAEENTVYQGDESGETTFQHDNLYSVKNEDGTVTEYKHSLMMTENEERLIAYVKEHCDVVIVAWTGATSFEMSLLQNDEGIDGIVWTNEYGENGATAFAEILSGSVNPSGKTESVWYSDFTADPTWYNVAWQRQIYGFAGTTLPTSGNFSGFSQAYGYTLDELEAFPSDSDYQEAVGEEATRYPGLIRVSDVDTGADYTKWPAVAGPCTGLSGMFDYGFGYEYRVNLQYDEGIYMGYKYYETAAADGKLDYDKAVVYPFGFGLSYTDFSWELVDADTSKWDAFLSKTAENGVVDLTGDECQDAVMTFKVKVTNTGSVAGKDVVELYAHAPYIDGEVEKSEVVLVSFEKTSLLQPGQSEVLTLTVNIQDMASFDYNDANGNGKTTYELDAGNGYELRFQTDSHTVKDGLKVALSALASDVIMSYDDYSGNAAEAVLSQENIYNSLGWDLDYTLTDANGDDTSNFITRVDKDSTGDEDMILMTRASSAYTEGYEDVFGGYTNPKYTPVTLQDLVRSDEYFALRNNLDGYDADYPTYADGTSVEDIWAEWKDGSSKTGGEGAHNIVDSVTGEAISGFKGFGVGMWGTSFASTYAKEFAEFLESGTINGVAADQVTLDEQAVSVLFRDMFGVDLADAEGAAQWTEFMNQLTWWDVMEVCSNGGSTCALESIDKAKSQGGDSPRNWNGYNWGSMSTMACTWNKELCYKIGIMYGNLGKLKNGNDGADWWGPGGDTHRTPFCGRYNDYFSQDGYQGGQIAAAIISGAQSRGVSCMIKHIALNDQEASRGGMSTYCSEQACRENYFKIFQIAMQEGGAKATMGSLACIGDIYPNCNYAFAKLLVRDEWGWMGFFATDGYGGSDTYWPMDLIVRCTTWPLGADPLTDNSVQNYLSGSWHDGSSKQEGVYTGYVDGTTAEGSAIGSTYTYETDIANNENAVYNPTQYYWARTVAQYVLYTQSTAATIRNGMDLSLFSGESSMATAQNEEVSLTIAVPEYAENCGDNVTYLVSEGDLPDGITCSEDGVISGKATKSGSFEATITCRIDNWLTTTRTVKVDVASKFILDDPENAIANAQAGVELAGAPCILYLDSEDDDAAYTYAVSEGNLPDGVTLDESTGTLSGAPLAAGTYKAVISVTPEQTASAMPQMMGPGMMGRNTKAEPIAYYELVMTVQ